MSKLIEEQVVKMQFDNKGFESGVKQTMSTLDKFKSALHFKDINMSPLEKAFSQTEATATQAGFHIKDVWLKMSEVFEYQIARKIVNAGEKIVKALTIEGAMDGFNEYELKMGSIQTIMAGTGESLATVNRYLDELNTYSDKTIYSFKDMTSNIGKFTNAGVSLDDAVNAIKGVANEAAVSGANANEASRAMYNFAQALSAGYVKLIDWKSIENANMATKEFKQTLIDVAVGLGTVIKKGDDYQSTTKDANGNVSELFNSTKMFNDSLSSQWMTTDVLTKALKIYATDVRELSESEKLAYEQELKNLGISDEQIAKFEELGIKAADAATEIKTFSMLMDTLKEAIGSGWAMTWQLIVGDFEQAKELWTDVGNTIGGVIDNMSSARNELLKGGLQTGWEKLTTYMDSVIPASEMFRESITQNAVKLKLLTEAEADNMETTSDWIKGVREKGIITKDFLEANLNEYYATLEHMTEAERKALGVDDASMKDFRYFIFQMHNGKVNVDEFANALNEMGGRENIISGLKSAFDGLKPILSSIGEAWREVFNPITSEDIKNLTIRFKELMERMKPTEETVNKIKTVFKGFFSILDIGKKVLTVIGLELKEFFGSDLMKSVGKTFADATVSLSEFFIELNNGFSVEEFKKKLDTGIIAAIKSFVDKIRGLFSSKDAGKDFNLFESITNSIDKFKNKISELLKGFGSSKSLNVDKYLDGFKETFSKIKEAFLKIINDLSFGDILSGTLTVSIVAALTNLSNLFKTLKGSVSDLLKMLKNNKFAKDLIKPITDFKNQILKTVKSVSEGLNDSLKSLTAGINIVSIVSIAAAIGILVTSLVKLAKLNPEEILKSLSAIGVLMVGLNLSLKSITKTLGGNGSKGLIKAGISLVLFSEAIKVMAKALAMVGDLPLNNILKGLLGIGLMMAEMAVAAKVLDSVKIKVSTAVSMILIAESLKVVSDALSTIGFMSWDEITKGLSAMTIALSEMVAFTTILNKLSGMKSILGSLSIAIITNSLSEIAEALKTFGYMSWNQIATGLTAMGGALTELSLTSIALSKLSGISGVISSIGLDILIAGLGKLSKVLVAMGSMSWSQVGRSLTAMGGALTEMTVITAVLSKFSVVNTSAAAATLSTLMFMLPTLSKALKELGTMSWSQVERGLTALGGALTELSLITGLLGKFGGFSSIIGAATIGIVIKPLSKLAEALKKFGSMSWKQIGRGLTAMGGALIEVGGFSAALGLIAGIPSLIGAATINVIVKPLDDLAEALKKFGTMTWSEITTGLTAMGGALIEVGGFSAALGLIGGLSGIIGAATIVIVTQCLDDLSAAMIKFGTMSWSEISTGLTAMGGALAVVGGMSAVIGKIGGIATLIGGISISTAVEGLGELADAMVKFGSMSWEDVKNGSRAMSEALLNLATGSLMNALSILGSLSIKTAAEPLGILADSVTKWKDVTVPPNLGTNLESLAMGVKAFSPAALGGLSIGTVSGPLGTLADSVTKWKNVTIPYAIGEKLASIAEGVKSFTWLFLAGWSLSAIDGPLGTLAESITKWKNVSIPANLSSDLISLSEGIKTFSLAFIAGWSLDSISLSLSTLADSLIKFNTVDINNVTVAFTNLATINLAAVSEAFSTDVTVTSAITTLINNICNILLMNQENVNTAFRNFATTALQNMKTGIDTCFESLVLPSVLSMIKSINDTLSSKMQPSAYYTYGRNVSIGLAQGIDSASETAIAACTSLGERVAAALQQALDEHSPSKLSRKMGIFWDKGLSNGINDGTGEVIKSTNSLADSVISSTNVISSAIKAALDSDIDYQPTIRPVVDTSDIAEKSKEINRLMSLDKQAKRTSMSFNSSDLALVRTVSGSFSSAVTNAKKSSGNTEEEKANAQNNYNFVQNNYSPKALSRLEIYRQTNNQISSLRSAMG